MKVAIVTGASSGLGREFVKQIAEKYSKLDEIAFLAFDDQCTLANPIYPTIEELKQILIDAYWGNI